MIVIGLTGSVGMGKSTVAGMLRQLHVPVFDADAAVHHLQGPGGALLPAIEARFPGTTGPGGVNRARLGMLVLGDVAALRALEQIVHPAVQAMRQAFLRQHRSRPLVVLDIPLLFETGADRTADQVIVVSAPFLVQRRRVLARPAMTERKFRQILARQMPDSIKRRRADFVIETGRTKAQTFGSVRRLVTCLRRKASR